MPLLFSYGSNSLAQLSGRIVFPGEPQLPPPRAAVLPGWARVFCGHSSTWSGGVANLHPSPGHSARGSLFLVSDAQLDRLDAYEGAYARTPVQPHDLSGAVCPAVAYIHREGVFSAPPSEAYLCAISRMLNEVHVNAGDVPLLRPDGEGVALFSGNADWRHPGVSQLHTLLALCYEAGVRATPAWTLPRDAVSAAARLERAGFSDAPAVVEVLMGGREGGIEALRDALCGEDVLRTLQNAVCVVLEAAPCE